jgi:hypothetical protein
VGRRPGELITKPLLLGPGQLQLNLAAVAAGEALVELQAADGTPLPGFGLAECRPLIGNDLSMPVVWERHRRLGAFASQPVRVRIRLQEARLLALQVAAGKQADLWRRCCRRGGEIASAPGAAGRQNPNTLVLGVLPPEGLRAVLVQVKIPAPSFVQVIGSSRPGTSSRLWQVLTPPMLRAQSNHSPSRRRRQLAVPSPLPKHSTFTTSANTGGGAAAVSVAVSRTSRVRGFTNPAI